MTSPSLRNRSTGRCRASVGPPHDKSWRSSWGRCPKPSWPPRTSTPTASDPRFNPPSPGPTKRKLVALLGQRTIFQAGTRRLTTAALWGGATSGNAGGAGAGSSTAGGGGGGGTFSDDDESVDAEPLWPTEANPAAAAAAAAAAVGLGGDRTPSPTEAQRLAAEGGALGASEERQDAARAAEARAAANAMFSQLSGSDAVGRPLTGTGYVSPANPLAPPASAKPAVFSLRPRSAATPKFSTGLNGTGHTPRGNADATGS